MKRNANRHNRFLNFGLAAQAAILALVLLSVSFLPRVIFAATFTVAPDSEYQTIQSAIGASSNGDTVLVAPGVYRENVAFGGRIILKAENAAPGATVIEAVDPAVSAITAAGPAEINGFTIRGATNSAGIRLNYGAWEAKISNNIIESNLDGIYIVNYGSGNSEITRNIFRDNTGYDINLPAEYNSSAGVSTQSAGNIIYLNDFYGTLYPYQDYVNYWNSQEELGYKYQNKIYRGKPGNYQPQCQTEDPDGDGIGNAACPIGGYTDSFPLVQPFENYEIAGGKDKFVYVALGDSYQSGEGAGNSIEGAEEYLARAYEQGTYTDTLIAGDNSCHRALQNYAKINKNKFHPELNDEDIVLIDLTCSGAKIENGSQPPVIGDMAADQIAPDSQLQQALNKLNDAGLTPADVDLVTVGMGGNGAGFVEIIQACLLPNILRKALQEYPNPPAEIKTLVDMFASCKNIDDNLFDSNAAINALYAKEVWAQNKILQTFAKARVIQADYPDILPRNTKSLSYCGGLRKEDIGYARGKVNAINEKINQAKLAVAQSNPRLELASLQSSLGGNALCPANAATALANGVKEANLNAEIRRLLNLDGNGDAQSRALIDNLLAAYNSWKQCLGVHLNVFDGGADCDVNTAFNQVKNLSTSLLNYLSNTDQMRIILANLVDYSNGNLNIRYDRSKGLFHPNAKGYDVIACNILAAHNKTGAEDCLPSAGQAVMDAVNGVLINNIPIGILPGQTISLYLGGFAPGAIVPIMILSEPKKIGEAIVDENGIIDTEILLPEMNPGVHTIILESQNDAGVGIAKQFRVNYPGLPRAGESYGVYFDNIAIDEGEKINIIYGGANFGNLTSDEDGGVFVELPVFEGQELFQAMAKNQTTGEVLQTSAEVEKPRQSLRSLAVKTAFIKWQKAKNKNQEFAIAGQFELPRDFSKDNLAKNIELKLIFSGGKTAVASLSFKENNIFWKYEKLAAAQNLKISRAIVYWSPEKKFCGNSKICAAALKNKNWFYLQGELENLGLEIDKTGEMEIEIVLPARIADLAGRQKLPMKKIGNQRFYNSAWPLSFWPQNLESFYK